ncbi:MAG: TetR/AcrR family bet gene transcriptional repressor [Pseudoalteromonas tetraodonis]|jgi:TetR/AcrR family transcriptional repressor of bet genes
MSKASLNSEQTKMSKTKLRLVQATLESLMAEGIEGCSVRKISERAKVSTGLINYHYPTINHLVADAYTHLSLRFLNSAIELSAAYKDRPRQQATVFLNAIFAEDVMQRNVLRAWVVFWGLIDATPEMQTAHKDSNKAFNAYLESMFKALGTTNQKLSPSSQKLSPKMAASGLSAMIDGLWLEWCLQTDSFTCTECIQICEHWVDSLHQAK